MSGNKKGTISLLMYIYQENHVLLNYHAPSWCLSTGHHLRYSRIVVIGNVVTMTQYSVYRLIL